MKRLYVYVDRGLFNQISDFFGLGDIIMSIGYGDQNFVSLNFVIIKVLFLNFIVQLTPPH